MQNELMQFPAEYWLKRADRLRKNGDRRRAAVLLRHAVRTHPESDSACMHYAFILRELGCFEASSREAFAAMAAVPSRSWMWGLIGLNMLSVGKRSAAMDALGLYLEGEGPSADHLPPWNDEACCTADFLSESGTEPPKRRARLNGLMRRAARRLQQRKLDEARCALERASSRPWPARDPKRDLLWATYHLLTGNALECAGFLASAASSGKPQILAAAAGLCGQLGEMTIARNLLLRAAIAAAAPGDETAVCLASDELHLPRAAEGMLRRSLKRRADRFPVCYNLCVCLLRQGRWEEAVPFIHRCREIDPDDPSGEILFSLAARMEGADAEQVRRMASACTYYGAFSQTELEACAAPVTEAASAGPEALAARLREDARLRGRILQLAAMPLEWAGGLVSVTAEACGGRDAEAFLREVLLAPDASDAARSTAVSLLVQMGAQPPFPLWADGRFLLVDPTRPPDPEPTFLQRHITRRIHQAQKLCPGERNLSLWCVALVRCMNHAQRCALVRDPYHVFPAALAIAYCDQAGAAPPRLFGEVNQEALSDALRMIQQIIQGGNNHADH